MVVGAAWQLIIAFVSLTLHQPQVATGFVLTLLCRDLAYVLGNPYAHVPGPQVPHTPIPGLAASRWSGRSCSTRTRSSTSAWWPIVLAWAYMYQDPARAEAAGPGRAPGRGLRARRQRQR